MQAGVDDIAIYRTSLLSMSKLPRVKPLLFKNA